MPTYTVTDPQTGKTLSLIGDSPPTEAELDHIFRQSAPVPADPVAAAQLADYQRRQEAALAAENAPSELGSFSREAGRSVIPGAAGFASGAMSGAALGAAGLNPITVGIGGIVGGIAGAFGTRYAQDEIADSVAPDSFMGTKSAAADFQTNPMSSLLGGAIAQGRPGPLKLGNALRSIGTAEGRALLAEGMQAGASPLAQTALRDTVDVGLGASIGGGMSLASGDGMAPENAAIGALFNSPWLGHAPAPHAPEAPQTTALTVHQPEVIRGPVTRMNGEQIEPYQPWIYAPPKAIGEGPRGLPAPEAPRLPAPTESPALPEPPKGRRDSPAVVDVPQQDANRELINQLEEEFVSNRTRREELAARMKDEGKPLNKGEARRALNLLDQRAAEIEQQAEDLRAGRVINQQGPETRDFVEVDNRPLGSKPLDRLALPEPEPPARRMGTQTDLQSGPVIELPGETQPKPRIRFDSPEAAPLVARLDEIKAIGEARHAELGPDLAGLIHPSELLTSDERAEFHDLQMSMRPKSSEEARADIMKRRAARAGTIASDTATPDLIDFVAEHRINLPAMEKRGGEYDSFREWHRSLPPLYKSNRHFSTEGGRGIAEVAQVAHEAGLIRDNTPESLMSEYSKAIQTRKTIRTTGDLNPIESKDFALERKAPRQKREFDEALKTNKRSRAGDKVFAGELSEGDTLRIAGAGNENFKVTHADVVEGFDGPEGTIVLQDHDRFGTQIVDAGQPLRVIGKKPGQVFPAESERASDVISRRQTDSGEVDAHIVAEAEYQPEEDPRFLTEPRKAPASAMDRKNADSRELFSDDGGFKLTQETTRDGDKITRQRQEKEAADAATDAAQSRLFDEPPQGEEKTSILDALKAHRANVDASIKKGGASYMSITGLTPRDVKLVYRAALDAAINILEAGQSVKAAVSKAMESLRTAAPRMTDKEAKVAERRLYTEVDEARRFGNGRDARFKVEMPKVFRDLQARGITSPTVADVTKELVSRFPDQAQYIRKNADRMFDEMTFQRDRLKGKSEKAREWSDWLDSALEEGSKIVDWAKRGTPVKDILNKASLINATYLGSIGSKFHALADGRLMGRESDALKTFVNEFIGIEAGAGGVRQRGNDFIHKTDEGHYSNRLSDIFRDADAYLKKRPKADRQAFYEAITEHIVDPSRDGELASQPELKKAVEGIIQLRRDLFDMKKAAGVDLGDAGPRSMHRRPDAAKILGHEKEFVRQAAKAYADTWKAEVADLTTKARAALAAGKKPEHDRLMAKVAEIQQQDATEFAERYLYAIKSDDIGISADGNGDLFVPHNGNPDSEKSRVFGPEADQYLGKFYERDPRVLMRRDISEGTRAAAVAKALSGKAPDGSIDPVGRWKKLRAAMEAEGNQELVPIAAELIKHYFNLGGMENPKLRKVLELSHMHTQIGRLSHAMLASFGEPTMIGNRTGRLRDIPNAFKETAVSFTRRLRKATPSEWQIIANFMGSSTSGLDALMTAARHMDAFGGRKGEGLVTRFHVMTMLSDWTNATHEAAVKLGHSFILGQLKTAKSGGAFERLARRHLNEVGISGKEIDRMLAFASKVEAAPDKAALITADTADARMYRDALHLFRESASLDPTRGTRPEYANTPLGSLFYQLTSFLYAFHDKVTMRSIRYLTDAAKGRTMIDGVETALNQAERFAITKNILTGFAAIAATQYGVQKMREGLLPDPVRDLKNKDRKPSEISTDRALSVLSRSGFLGPYDTLFNLITGARYQRDPASAVLGPALGGASELFGNTVRLLNERTVDALNRRDADGPQSNYTARKFGRNVADMLITPGLNALGATLPGRVPGGILIQGASSPRFRETVTRSIGEPMRTKEKKKDDGY